MLVLLHCRIQRDVNQRGRDVAGVLSQYTKFVKPAFDEFVAPSRKIADVIIPWARCAVASAGHYILNQFICLAALMAIQ